MVDFIDQPDDSVKFTAPDSNEMVEEPHIESQPLIAVDKITSIVSAIVESKMATLANTGSNILGQAAPQLWHQTSTLGIPTLCNNYCHCHLIALVTSRRTWMKKTRKAILKGEYIDFVSPLHENSTASSNINKLLTLTVNGESLPISFPGQRRSKKVPIDSFD